jgi:hypothetical protein
LLEAAIGDAQAVICATGFSGINPLNVGAVDEKVRHPTKYIVCVSQGAGILLVGNTRLRQAIPTHALNEPALSHLHFPFLAGVCCGVVA